MSLLTPKRDGLVAIFLMTAAVLCALGYYLWGPWQQRPLAASSLPAMPDVQVPEAPVVKQMAALSKRLNHLAYPRGGAERAVSLGLFGYAPAAAGLRTTGRPSGGGVSPRAQFDYTLSFALAAGKRHLCLLDGQLYLQGAVLPDGGRILTIEPERVLIEKPPLRRWVYLQPTYPGREASAEGRPSTASPSASEDL